MYNHIPVVTFSNLFDFFNYCSYDAKDDDCDCNYFDRHSNTPFFFIIVGALKTPTLLYCSGSGITLSLSLDLQMFVYIICFWFK